MSDFTDSLQQASFAGIPFAVLGGDGRHGRRVALHEYPFKDKPWAEDIGRGTRRFNVSGFLITDSAIYGGGDVNDQLKQMIAAVETQDGGTLVHPVLGELTVSIPDGAFGWEMRWDQGRYYAIGFSCIESGEKEFPGDDNETGDQTDAAADDADGAAEDDYAITTTGSADFFTGITDALAEGSSVVDMVTATAGSWVDLVTGAANDATSLFNMLVELPGNFGRYFTGRTTGFASGLQPASTATVASLTAQGVALRGTVTVASDALLAAAAGTDPHATAKAGKGVAAALLAATADPADAVRVLTGLFNFYPARPTSPSITGMAEATVQTATGALLRRVTLGALARATALYQPASADDAANLRASVAALFSQEISTAGDAGDDASFSALGSLRAAVILDLDTRGAGLPALATIATAAPLPAFVLAQQLYQDPGRTDELITEANPIHPAFMPTSFPALGA